MIGDGGWLAILTILFFTFWFSIPILFNLDDENLGPLTRIGRYVIWVVIQVVIYRWGIGPPEGMGIPHF